MRLMNLAERLSENSIRALLRMKRQGRRLKILKTQYGRLRRKLATLDRRIQKLSTGATSLSAAPKAKRGRLSAAGRRRIILAQKRRWAGKKKG